MKDYVSGVIEHSGKMVILMEIIERCVLMREKILVFRYRHVLLTTGFTGCMPTHRSWQPFT